MLILGVDTSGKLGSIALVECGAESSRVLDLVPLEGGTFSAQLVPQISALLQKHGLKKHQVDAFAVVSGPGSFTGLRVGLGAVKALAGVLQKPIAGVSLLEVIASGVFVAGSGQPAVGSGPTCLAVIDAGRNEAFVAEYEASGSLPRLVKEQVLTYGELAQRAEHLGKGMLIRTPDEAVVERTTLRMKDPFLANFGIVPRPNAGTVGRFGWKKVVAGLTVTPEALDATYIRRSEAEVKFGRLP